MTTVLRRMLKGGENRIAARALYAGILEEQDPQAVLWDHRAGGGIWGRDVHVSWLRNNAVRTVLLPHAANHGGPDDFTPFADTPEPLPDWGRYWMPFIADAHWQACPQRMSQFDYVGCPGLDSDWLSRFQRQSRPLPVPRPRILVLLRAFLPPGRKVVDRTDPAYHSEAYLLETEELRALLRDVSGAIAASAPDAEVVFKPHPSTDFEAFATEVQAAGIKRWSISVAPIYPLLREIDAVVAIYSTILLVPAIHGIPTLLLHNRTLDYVAQWPALRALYTGLRLYLPNAASDLRPALSTVLDRLHTGDTDGWLAGITTADQAHVRHFFPDGATGRCVQAILTGERPAVAAALTDNPYAAPNHSTVNAGKATGSRAMASA